jgi:hypothetical protein
MSFLAPLDLNDFQTRCFLGMFATNMLNIAASELQGKTLSYSKFFSKENSMPGGSLPSRYGMGLIYIGPFLTAASFFVPVLEGVSKQVSHI